MYQIQDHRQIASQLANAAANTTANMQRKIPEKETTIGDVAQGAMSGYRAYKEGKELFGLGKEAIAANAAEKTAMEAAVQTGKTFLSTQSAADAAAASAMGDLAPIAAEVGAAEAATAVIPEGLAIAGEVGAAEAASIAAEAVVATAGTAAASMAGPLGLGIFALGSLLFS